MADTRSGEAELFDLVVLGTGAAGSTPARKCRQAGWRVAVVDDQPYGGTCAVRGCDPKKVLVGAADVVDWQRRMGGKGVRGDAAIDWASLLRFKRSFTDPVPAATERTLDELGVVTLHGAARFVAQDRLAVGDRELTARHVLVASGARPRPLGIRGEEHVRTSTDFLDLEALPARIVFIGAGYISLEFAHVSRRAGAQVVVLGRGAPLARFEQDVVRRLLAHTRDIGIDLRVDAEVTGIEQHGTEFRVHANTPRGPEAVTADLVVHGAGRIPNTDRLGAEQGHLELDSHGALAVNEYLQSVSNPRVYGAGDSTLPRGSLPLTPVAAYEGGIVATNLLEGNSRTPDYRGIPSVVFTIPPLASVGLTEAEARAQGIDVRVRAEDTGGWFSNRRVAEPAAMFKTVVDAATGTVVGAHLLGPHAEEVINLFALAIRHGLRATDLKHMIYSYPTSASDVAYML